MRAICYWQEVPHNAECLLVLYFSDYASTNEPKSEDTKEIFYEEQY